MTDDTPQHFIPKVADDSDQVARKNHDMTRMVSSCNLFVPRWMIHKLIENLHDIVLKFCGQFRTLNKGSESLNISLTHILTLSVKY